MTRTIVWRCDGEGCDRKEETNGHTPASISEAIVTVSQTQIWHGHLCNSCRDKLVNTFTQTMRIWTTIK